MHMVRLLQVACIDDRALHIKWRSVGTSFHVREEVEKEEEGVLRLSWSGGK